MKKYILSILVVSFCGVSKLKAQTTLCDCHEIQLKAALEYKEVKGDHDKALTIQEKYKAETKTCESIVSEMREEMKNLSPKEKKKQKKAYMKSCAAFKKLEKMKKKKK